MGECIHQSTHSLEWWKVDQSGFFNGCISGCRSLQLLFNGKWVKIWSSILFLFIWQVKQFITPCVYDNNIFTHHSPHTISSEPPGQWLVLSQTSLACKHTSPVWHIKWGSLHSTVMAGKQEENTEKNPKYVNKILEFGEYIWNHHEKCKHAWYWFRNVGNFDNFENQNDFDGWLSR